MHQPPAIQIDAQADPAWKVVLVLLGMTAGLCTATWAWWAWMEDFIGLGTLALGAGLASGLLTWQAWHQACQAHRLRWTGESWWLGRLPVAAPDDLTAVHPLVAIDLGGWMLLRLQACCPDGGSARLVPRRVAWLALSESRHRTGWHGLRCALHGAGDPVNAVEAAAGARIT